MFSAEQAEEYVTCNLNSSRNAKQLLSKNNHNGCLQDQVWCFAVRRPAGALWACVTRNTSLLLLQFSSGENSNMLVSLTPVATSARRSRRSKKWKKRRNRSKREKLGGERGGAGEGGAHQLAPPMLPRC